MILLISMTTVTAIHAQNSKSQTKYHTDEAKTGRIKIEDHLMQINVHEGEISITAVSENNKIKSNPFQDKVSSLVRLITTHLDNIIRKDDLPFSDGELLVEADSYVKGILSQLKQLNEHLSKRNELDSVDQKIKQAYELFDVYEIIRLLKNKKDTDNEKNAQTSFDLAGFQYVTQKYSEAEENYKRAISLDPNNPWYFIEAGIVAKKRGKREDAKKYLESALAINLKIHGETHSDVALVYNNLGLLYCSRDEYKKSIEYYEKSLNILLDIYDEIHCDIATAYSNIGMAWYSSFFYLEKSLPFFEKALEIRLRIFEEDHPEIAHLYNVLGLVWDAQGNREKAFEYYKKAKPIILETLGSDHPVYITFMANYKDYANYIPGQKKRKKTFTGRFIRNILPEKNIFSKRNIQKAKDYYMSDKDNNEPDLWPEIYGLKKTIFHIFPIPRDYSVGTTDIKNSFTCLSFVKNKVKYTTILRNYLKYVSGGKMNLLPTYSDNTVGYAQETRFILFDLKTKEFEKHTIFPNPDEEMKKVMVLDWETRKFVFEHIRFYDPSDGSDRKNDDCIDENGEVGNMNILQVFELQNGKTTKLAKKEIGQFRNGNKGWFVHDKKIFTHTINFDSLSIDSDFEVYDYSFNPISHPFVEIMKAHRLN
ncbi:MAG: tetratricopeptide repeat protein, partial [Chitinispirillia bacterium]